MWFLIAVVFFILWLDARKRYKDAKSEFYNIGYENGLKASRQAETEVDQSEFDPRGAEAIEVGNEAEESDTVSASLDIDRERQEALKKSPIAELTPEQREKRTVRNMNSLLYFASFLLVAAAATFIATSTPPAVRLSGLIAVVILFYSAGIVLHKKVKQLRPAATAFVGTGLAILPFVGVALHTLADVPESVAWLAISGIGLAAYYVGAIVLQSQVVSYLTMAFLISLVSAGVSTASLPIVWYFISLIGVSLVASSISVLKPQLLPRLFQEPVERTGQVVTPIVLVASLLCSPFMALIDYEVVLSVAAAHYLVVWLQQKIYRNEITARIMVHIAALCVIADLVNLDWSIFGLFTALLFVLQALYSLARVRLSKSKVVRRGETAWLIIMLVFLQFTPGMWAGLAQADVWNLLVQFIGTVLAVAAVLVFRNANWSYAGLVTSVLFAFTLTRGVLSPPMPWSGVAMLFGVAATVGVLGLWYAATNWRGGRSEKSLLVCSATYLMLMTFVSFGSGDAIFIGLILATLVVGMLAISYIIKLVSVEIAAILPFMVSVAYLLSETSFHQNRWYSTGVIMITVLALAIATAIHHSYGERNRRDGLFGVGLIALAGLLPAFFFTSEAVLYTHSAIFGAMAVAMIGARIALRNTSFRLRWMTTSAYVVYIIFAWLIALSLGALWAALIYVIATVIFWLASFVEKKWLLMVVGNVSIVAGLDSLWTGLGITSEWRVIGVGLIGAAMLYGTHWLLVERGDMKRSDIQIWSLWLLLVLTLALSSFDVGTIHVVVWSVALLLFAATVWAYGAMRRLAIVSELAIYMATVGLQRVVAVAVPELNMVFYAHWWALTVLAVAWWKEAAQYRTLRLIVAASLVTAAVGVTALTSGGWYQVLFLVEQVLFLAVGAVKSKRWLTWWGLVFASLAVIYFLRDYTYLWLAFLGLFLIGVVVWQLLRRGLNHKND